ncbi:MAG TPA: hypothetical protein VG013_22645 [Gemmataceae bacterium]|nr:hypothetical protein [Gemmataceae bacterium]
MTSTLFTLTVAVLLPAASPSHKESSRQPNPFAPSLPQLTDKEEEELDRVIDRFVQFDTGQLGGAAGKQALKEFQRLGPEAAFALIRGLNRAANIAASCPAVIIAKKLATQLRTTDDLQLLLFARENIGVGVTESKHKNVLKDLKFLCIVRQRALAQNAVVARHKPDSPGASTFRSMSVSDLVRAIGSQHGLRLKQAMNELEKRRGEQVTATLASLAASDENEAQSYARILLLRHLTRESPASVKKDLKDQRAEVRAAAARAVADKKLRFGAELIELLDDPAAGVRQAAHSALIRLTGGTDFGPGRDASEDDQAKALRQWRAWWAGTSNK